MVDNTRNEVDTSYGNKLIDSNYYHRKITEILEQIDDYRQESVYDKNRILNVSERVHALCLLLSNEMKKDEKLLQKRYIQKLREIKTNLFYNTKQVSASYETETTTHINPTVYIKYKSFLEQRERNLFQILKRIGFLGTKEKTRLY